MDKQFITLFSSLFFNCMISAQSGFPDGMQVNINMIGTFDIVGGITTGVEGHIIVSGYSGEDLIASDYISVSYIDVYGSMLNSFSDDGRYECAPDGGVFRLFPNLYALGTDDVLIGWSSMSQDSCGLLRLNVNGTPDNYFSGDGFAYIPSSFGNFHFRGMELLKRIQGGIVIAGDAWDNISNHQVPALLFLTEDGEINTAYGNNGLVVIPTNHDVHSVSAQINNDKIVIAGIYYGDAAEVPFIAQWNVSGLADENFAPSGIKIFENGEFDDQIEIKDIELDPIDGYWLSIFKTGFTGIAKLNGAGDFMTSFGGDGIAEYNALVSCKSMIPQTDGKVVGIAPYNNSEFTVFRLTSAGEYDDSFGTSGNYIHNFGTSSPDVFMSIALQENGRILGGLTVGGALTMKIFRLYNEIENNMLTNGDNELKIYPNPAKEFFNYELPSQYQGGEITVFDAIGKSILNEPILSSKAILKFSNWNSGTYTLTIRKKGFAEIHKLFIID